MTVSQILVPVTVHTRGDQLQSALSEVIVIARREPHTRVHLLAIQPPVSQYVTGYFRPDELRQAQLDAALQDLEEPRQLLDAALVRYKVHTRIGRSAPTIVAFAEEFGCDRVLMGRAGQAGVQEKLFGTLANQVRHLLSATGICQVIGY